MPRRNSQARAPQAVDSSIGARIRLRRKMMGITQSQMAERIGVTFQQLQKYEKGTNRIGASRILQICRVLEVAPAWLFENFAEFDTASVKGQGLDSIIAAFHADDTSPQLMLVWPLLPSGVKRSMIKVMTTIAHRGGAGAAFAAPGD